MEGFLGNAYPFIKAAHIIVVIFWMAALFMMPRFFAYHMETTPGSAEDDNWKERERRLLKIIMNPAMSVAWLLGIALVLNIGFGAGGWLHAKLLLVFLFTGFHHMLAAWHRKLVAGDRSRSSKFFRIANEVPALFIIIIVILAVAKPF